ncbi:MAG: hypothetical protein ABSG84_17755 [Acidobacteriaceae bacterium]|jgi:hypothetical protein
MYGRSGELDTGTIDLSFFKGTTLVQICLGANDLGLNFDLPPIQIMMQSGFGTRVVGQERALHDLTSGHILRNFLSREVSDASWGEKGTLILTFVGGDQVLIFDDNDQFEAYTISHPGHTIVV